MEVMEDVIASDHKQLTFSLEYVVTSSYSAAVEPTNSSCAVATWSHTCQLATSELDSA